MAGPSDPQFHKVVAERVAAGDPEREDSPAYLLQRLKQLEQENAALRQNKRSRPEDAAAELKKMVIELKHRSCAPDFPAQCAAALDRVSALIEDASDRGSFGQWLRAPLKARRSSASSCSPPSPRSTARRAAAPRCPLGAPG